MKHELVALSELLLEHRAGYWGVEASCGELMARVVRNTDVQPGGISLSRLPLRGFSAKEFTKAHLKPGDVVLTSSGECGRVAFIGDLTEPTVASNFVQILRADDRRIDVRFLFRFLNSPIAQNAWKPFVRGTTLKNLSTSTALSHIKVPTPPLAEQRHIVAVLDKADEVRRKRRETFALLEVLLRSVFLDLFGDPASNPKRWLTRTVAELATITTGNTPPRNRPDYYGDVMEWIKSDNLNTPKHVPTRATECLSESGMQRARIVEAGSILITCIAGTPACIGNAALADRRVAFNQQINALTPRPSMAPEFLYVQLLLGKRLIQAASTKSMKGMVSKGRLSSVRLPVPPRALQLRFADWFRGFLAAQEKAREAATAADTLFDSLAEQAFAPRP